MYAYICIMAESRSPVYITNPGPVSLEIRPINEKSGITHDSHCSLLFMPGLEEIPPQIWNILFSF